MSTVTIKSTNGKELFVASNPGSVQLTGSITTTTMLDAVALGAGATTAIGDCVALDLSTMPPGGMVSITVDVDYSATHSGGVTIKFYGSHDGTNYDDEEFAVGSIASNAGGTKQKSFVLDVGGLKGLKITVTNNDGSNALDSVSAYGNVRK